MGCLSIFLPWRVIKVLVLISGREIFGTGSLILWSSERKPSVLTCPPPSQARTGYWGTTVMSSLLGCPLLQPCQDHQPRIGCCLAAPSTSPLNTRGKTRLRVSGETTLTGSSRWVTRQGSWWRRTG